MPQNWNIGTRLKSTLITLQINCSLPLKPITILWFWSWNSALFMPIFQYVCREHYPKHAAFPFINLGWKLAAINLAFLQQGNISKYFPYAIIEEVVCFGKHLLRLRKHFYNHFKFWTNLEQWSPEHGVTGVLCHLEEVWYVLGIPSKGAVSFQVPNNYWNCFWGIKWEHRLHELWPRNYIL